MYGYIYKTTNLINNKIYIGQKKSQIFLGNKYLGSGKYLKRALEKYGKENFKVELLEVADSRDELSKLEIYYILIYNSIDKNIGYNIAKGGIGGGEVYIHNLFLNRLIPKVLLESYIEEGWLIGMLPGRKEINHSKTRGLNISKSLTGKPKSVLHILNHKESLKAAHRHWYTNGTSNILLAKDELIPIGFYRGRTISQELINKLKNINLGKIPWNKGLTKETDNRILNSSLKLKAYFSLKRK